METQTRDGLKHPNEQLFEKYGEVDDPESVLFKSQILVIRHGLSEFNH